MTRDDHRSRKAEETEMTALSTTMIERQATATEPVSATSWIKPWLRAEGAATFAAGLAGFLWLGVPWYAFPLLLLVPDASAIGYLRGPRLGAFVYNLVHDLATGVAVAGIGLALGSVPIAAAGAILVAHSGMDRMAGYGLKLPTSFKDTHMGRIGRDR
jgi:hypothetical protein